MNNELLNTLAKRIVENGQSKKEFSFHFHNIGENLKVFLDSQVSEKNKELVLENLYLLQLYSDAYISSDPRFKQNKMLKIKSMFQEITNDEECERFIDELNNIVDLFEKSEVSPIETAKKILKDKEVVKGSTF